MAEDASQDSQATSRTLMDAMLGDPLSERLWNRFQKRYRKIIYDWCVAKKLQPADADDVTQDVFRRLVAAMRAAQYDPTRRFRAYLRGVVNHALADHFRARGRRHEIDGDRAAGVLDGVAAPPDELVKRLELAVDDELLDAAKSTVRSKLRDDGKQEWWTLYDAFLNTRLRRAEFAREHAVTHQLSVDAAQQRLTRVTRMIRDAYERLAGPDEQ
jgi:RNA polymerase sigma factor (sigma-70 family)